MKKRMMTLAVALMSFGLQAADLTNVLSVVQVNHSSNNQIGAGVPDANSCPRGFKGTYSGNTVVLRPYGKNGSGKYSHKIVYTLSDSYKFLNGQATQFEKAVDDGDEVELKLPELRDEVPFVQQTVFLITTDRRTGKTKTSNMMFNVSRPVILMQATDPAKAATGCRQTFPAFESVTGILSNGSTNPSELLIKHGVQSIWERTSGTQSGFGFHFSPLAWTVLGNIFSLSYQKNYFKQFSKQTIETVEVSAGYQLSPGDFIQIYEQRTRYVTPFDAVKVSPCGYQTKLEGTYFMQWWGVAYHAVPVNPMSTERLPLETIGARPMNTCSDDLTPDFAREGSGNYNFVKTN